MIDPLRYFTGYLAISLLIFYFFFKKKADEKTELYPDGVRWFTYALLIPVSIPAALAVLAAATIDVTKDHWARKRRKTKRLEEAEK